MLNTTGATSEEATTYPSETPEFIPGFKWGCVLLNLYFSV